MAAYGYARVSTADQATDDRTSLDSQRRRIEGLALAADLSLTQVFIEPAVSGSKPFRERPEGSRLWGLLQDGDSLIAAKLDRLFRSAGDALATADELKKRGVALYILDMGIEPVTGTGAARMFFGLLALVAEFERQRILERISEGQRAKRQRGGHVGGLRPFGWDVVGSGRGATLSPNAAEQAAIPRIRAAHAEGVSLRRISADLAAQGIRLSHQGVKRMLARPIAG